VNPRGQRRGAAGRILRRLAFAAALAASGCATPVGFSVTDLARLRHRAVAPEALGRGFVREGPQARLGPVRVWAERKPATLDFLARQPGAAVLPLVRVSVNRRTTNALVDSGAGGTVMDLHGAERTGVLPLRAPAGPGGRGDLILLPGRGLGSAFVHCLGIAGEFSAGPARVRHVPVGIVALPDGFGRTGWLDGARVELLVGADLLGLFDAVTFDFPRARLELRTEAPAPPAGALVCPLLRRDPVPMVNARLSGFGELPVAVDTGGDFGLWIPAGLARELGVVLAAEGEAVRYGRGLGGATAATPAGTHTLELGGRKVVRVPVLVGAGGAGRPDIPYALLGREVLARYAVTLDYANNRLLLAPP
jgi:hypothetical protein